jgi:hypothetical protein
MELEALAENFSAANYISRYCDCSRSEGRSDRTEQGCFRTVDCYNAATETITNDPAYVEDMKIKARSIFNVSEYFHVCQHG